MDKVYALPNLQLAWERVQANGGSAGIDGLTIEMFARNSERRLEALSADLKAKTYRPKPVRRVEIPKADGGKRPLGIPAIHDRIVQQALLQVLTPVFEPIFSDRSHGFRPLRGTDTALEVVDRAILHYRWVVDADIKGFFDNVDHDILLAAVNEEVSDGSVLNLISAILKAGVIQPGVTEMAPTELGTPQGGPLSPLLANIYLHRLDKAMEGQHHMVRYADDFVLFAKTQSEAEAGLQHAREVLEGELKLTLHPVKTRIVTVESGFVFLGFHYYCTRPSRNYPNGIVEKKPSAKAMQKFRDGLRQRTPRIGNQTKPKKRSFSASHLKANKRLMAMVAELNRYLRSWFAYFHKSRMPWANAFDYVDQRVRARLRIALTGRVGPGWWTVVLKNSVFHDVLKLVCLNDLYLTDKYRRALLPVWKD